MKRFSGIMLVATFIFSLVGCSAKKSRTDIFNLVESNYDVIVAACESKNEEALLAIDDISKVKIEDGYQTANHVIMNTPFVMACKSLQFRKQSHKTVKSITGHFDAGYAERR